MIYSRVPLIVILGVAFSSCGRVGEESLPKGRPEAVEALASAPPLPGDYRLPLLMKDDRTPTAASLSARLGIPVEAAASEASQFILHARPGSVDLSVLGRVNTDAGYAVGITLPSGAQIGFRYAADATLPTPQELSAKLGVQVEAAPNAPNQFILHAASGTVDLSVLGKVNTDVGYAVGITLPSGAQIGFRYTARATLPSPQELSTKLGVQVDAAPNEPNQYILRASPGTVDLSTLGTIHTDLGYAVGVTLASGVQIGFRFAPELRHEEQRR